MISDNLRSEYTKIAYYYYKSGMTQDEIAKRMSISRQKVNRVLKKCLEEGIVKISIDGYAYEGIEAETKLESMLGLDRIIIVAGPGKEVLGNAAAVYLKGVIKDNDIIGFSGGKALSSIVDNLKSVEAGNLSVTQLVGILNTNGEYGSSDYIVRKAADKLSAKPHFIYAPMVLNNKLLRDSLLKDDFYTDVFNAMRTCTIAMVLIGGMDHICSLTQTKFVSNEEVEDLKRKEAVGEVCTHFFDINGNAISSTINSRVLSIDIDSYKKIPLKVGIGKGTESIEAIIGAARSKLINVLITDYETSQKLLNSGI
jgi:DNA-binding transcriptional regulator LsrR (DeoR family)